MQARPRVDLTAVRGAAPRRAPNVRVLAAFAEHADCNTAALGFAAGVDFDKLLVGTGLEAPFGQSPFSFARGNQFERQVAANGYAQTLALLRDHYGFDVSDARIANLRDVGYPKNRAGLLLRTRDTRTVIGEILAGSPAAPNLIAGAVFERPVAGIPAHFEADAIAARFGGPIHAGEVKSFPVVDGRADPEKLGAALDQVALYILLAKETVTQLGANPNRVSTDALIITPRNVGLQPTLSTKDVARQVGRMERLLRQAPNVVELASDLAYGVSFGAVADSTTDPAARVRALDNITDQVGTTFKPSCFASCGLARFCRERMHEVSSPRLVGPHAARSLPGVRSLERAAELTAGAPPTDGERPVARQLLTAGQLYDRYTSGSRSGAAGSEGGQGSRRRRAMQG